MSQWKSHLDTDLSSRFVWYLQIGRSLAPLARKIETWNLFSRCCVSVATFFTSSVTYDRWNVTLFLQHNDTAVAMVSSYVGKIHGLFVHADFFLRSSYIDTGNARYVRELRACRQNRWKVTIYLSHVAVVIAHVCNDMFLPTLHQSYQLRLQIET